MQTRAILARALLNFDAFPSIAQIASIANDLGFGFTNESSKPLRPVENPDCECRGQGFYFILLQSSLDESQISRPVVSCPKCSVGAYNRKYQKNAGIKHSKLIEIPMYYESELKNCFILDRSWQREALVDLKK